MPVRSTILVFTMRYIPVSAYHQAFTSVQLPLVRKVHEIFHYFSLTITHCFPTSHACQWTEPHTCDRCLLVLGLASACLPLHTVILPEHACSRSSHPTPPQHNIAHTLICHRFMYRAFTLTASSLVKIDTHNFELSVILSYHGNRHRQDQLQYTVPQLACSVKMKRWTCYYSNNK